MVYGTKLRSSTATDRFEAPEKYVGYGVHDPNGKRIGRLKGLFLNGYDEPEYVLLKLAPFGLRTVLVPVQFVVADTERRTLTLK